MKREDYYKLRRIYRCSRARAAYLSDDERQEDYNPPFRKFFDSLNREWESHYNIPDMIKRLAYIRQLGLHPELVRLTFQGAYRQNTMYSRANPTVTPGWGDYLWRDVKFPR